METKTFQPKYTHLSIQRGYDRYIRNSPKMKKQELDMNKSLKKVSQSPKLTQQERAGASAISPPSGGNFTTVFEELREDSEERFKINPH